jgi:hypothetical protein
MDLKDGAGRRAPCITEITGLGDQRIRQAAVFSRGPPITFEVVNN